MYLLREAFIEGYKQRAESSNLIFDNTSRMYAISLFDKWKSEQLLLQNVVGQSEQFFAFTDWYFSKDKEVAEALRPEFEYWLKSKGK